LLQLRTAVDVVVPVERGQDGRRRVLGVWGWDVATEGLRPPVLVPLVDVEGRPVRAGRHANATAA